MAWFEVHCFAGGLIYYAHNIKQGLMKQLFVSTCPQVGNYLGAGMAPFSLPVVLHHHHHHHYLHVGPFPDPDEPR